jgi:hypothetical protein
MMGLHDGDPGREPKPLVMQADARLRNEPRSVMPGGVVYIEWDPVWVIIGAGIGGRSVV